MSIPITSDSLSLRMTEMTGNCRHFGQFCVDGDYQNSRYLKGYLMSKPLDSQGEWSEYLPLPLLPVGAVPVEPVIRRGIGVACSLERKRSGRDHPKSQRLKAVKRYHIWIVKVLWPLTRPGYFLWMVVKNYFLPFRVMEWCQDT